MDNLYKELNYCMFLSTVTADVEEVKSLICDFHDDFKVQDLPATFYRVSDHNPVLTRAHYK